MQKFYSEYGEDRWIFENLIAGTFAGRSMPKRGFYLDIGAMRPDVNSNTAMLRDMGWSGIAIDGHPDCARWWQGVDCDYVTAVLDSESGQAHFSHCAAESGIIDGPTDVPGRPVSCYPTVTLQSVLDEREVGEIDLLSIDIEGKEFDVLLALDWERHRPAVIVAEYATLQRDRSVKEDFRLRDMLVGSGRYRVVHQTVANLIYVRQ
jgi:FkbM family methyltransferase